MTLCEMGSWPRRQWQITWYFSVLTLYEDGDHIVHYVEMDLRESDMPQTNSIANRDKHAHDDVFPWNTSRVDIPLWRESTDYWCIHQTRGQRSLDDFLAVVVEITAKLPVITVIIGFAMPLPVPVLPCCHLDP